MKQILLPPLVQKNGYTEHICIDCGYKYITDLTPLAKHDYRPTVTAPTCKNKKAFYHIQVQKLG